MVVEDDPIFSLLVKRVAAQLGHSEHLRLCSNLKQAQEVAAEAEFWVVDLNLPDGFGPDWVKQQRQRGWTQSVQFLSHTDSPPDMGSLVPCLFATKPRSLDELHSMMKDWWPA